MRIYRPLLLLTCMLISSAVVHGQVKMQGRNAVYADYSLEGPVYSINYDRIFAQSAKLNYFFRAGFSIINDQAAFPLGVGLITGHNDHHFELAMLFIPLVESKKTGGVTDNDKFIYLFPAAGYRYQKSDGGIFFHALAGPMIILDPAEGDFWQMDPMVKFSFSLGLGFNFGQ